MSHNLPFLAVFSCTKCQSTTPKKQKPKRAFGLPKICLLVKSSLFLIITQKLILTEYSKNTTFQYGFLTVGGNVHTGGWKVLVCSLGSSPQESCELSTLQQFFHMPFLWLNFPGLISLFEFFNDVGTSKVCSLGKHN